jgi:hypothetical protein
MSCRKKDPLRSLTDAERLALTRLSRSDAAPAVQVARATMIVAVACDDYQKDASAAGRRSSDAVAHLVARFNVEGLTALSPRQGGGQPRVDDHASRERILDWRSGSPRSRGSGESMIMPHASESSVRPDESRHPKPTAPPPGHSRR